MRSELKRKFSERYNPSRKLYYQINFVHQIKHIGSFIIKLQSANI